MTCDFLRAVLEPDDHRYSVKGRPGGMAAAMVNGMFFLSSSSSLISTFHRWAEIVVIVTEDGLMNTPFADTRIQGAGKLRIIVSHVMPICIPSVIIRITLNMAGIILTAAGLGFLGLGAQPPLPEWGAMLASGRQFMLTNWWLAAAPGAAIMVVSLSFNLLGDGLRDVLDPRHG